MLDPYATPEEAAAARANRTGGGWEFLTSPFLLPNYADWTMTHENPWSATYHAPPTKGGFSSSGGTGQASSGTAGGSGADAGYGAAHTVPETLQPIAQGTDLAGLGYSPEALGLGGAAAGAGSMAIDFGTAASNAAGGTASGWSKVLDKVGGYKGLFQLLAKGFTLYELYKSVTGDSPKAPDTAGGGKKGKGGGGGGGSKFSGPSIVPSYQGLNYQPQFLAWQPTNAGSPQFTSGGPSSLYGTPTPPPPPPVKKKKKAGT